MIFSLYFMCSMLSTIDFSVALQLNFVCLISFVVVLIMEDQQLWLVLKTHS